MKTLVALLSLCLSQLSIGGEVNGQRAHYNYQMFCQGCHTPDGSGAQSVPRMKDHVGFFLASTEGREYLVQVPGSATSALNDEELAEVLNWILEEFAGESLEKDYRPYSAGEVSQLRKSPLNEVTQYRGKLLDDISNTAVSGNLSKTTRE